MHDPRPRLTRVGIPLVMRQLQVLMPTRPARTHVHDAHIVRHQHQPVKTSATSDCAHAFSLLPMPTAIMTASHTHHHTRQCPPAVERQSGTFGTSDSRGTHIKILYWRSCRCG